LIPYRESHTAFVTDKSTGKTKTSTKEKPMKGGLQEKSSSLSKPSDNACFICGKTGHYCRDCPERKSTNLALIARDGDSGGGYSDADSEDDNSKHLAFVTTETALFSKHLLHLDSQSSTNVISNKRILVSGTIWKAARAIVLNGVDKDTPGIAIDLVGDMKDIGEVYYSPKATANILSFAAMTDAGAEISYDEKHGRFTMRPKGSENIYSFCRQDKPGCEGKFYVCDTRTMIAQKPTSHPQIDHAMVATVSENMQKYSKREERENC
jgi:Zinc knuckle